jgi:hypothetical protein
LLAGKLREFFDALQALLMAVSGGNLEASIFWVGMEDFWMLCPLS